MLTLRKWFVGTALCLVLALLPGERAAQRESLSALPVVPLAGTRAPRARIAVGVAGTLPKSPAIAMTYRIQYPQVDKEYVHALAAKLGLPSRAKDGTRTALVREGSRALEVYANTGAFWYKDASLLWAGAHPDPRLDVESGTKLVDALLQEWGLLGRGMLFEGTGHSEVTTYDVASGQSETHPTDLHVNYRLSIGGTPVEGPGGRVKVYLGDGYRVIGIYWAGFEVAPHKAYPILSAEEALSRLKEVGIATSVRSPLRATVTDVSLVYYAGPGLEAQEYLEPVYRLRGVVEGEEERRSFREYVPALSTRHRKVLPVLPETLGDVQDLDPRRKDETE